MTDIPKDILKAAEAAYPSVLSLKQELAVRLIADVIHAERRRCIEAQPSTAENPNESAYERGRFDGVMSYSRAILDAHAQFGGDLEEMQRAYRRAEIIEAHRAERRASVEGHPLTPLIRRMVDTMKEMES